MNRPLLKVPRSRNAVAISDTDTMTNTRTITIEIPPFSDGDAFKFRREFLRSLRLAISAAQTSAQLDVGTTVELLKALPAESV